MHRVELKEGSNGVKIASPSELFLMHRVELKVQPFLSLPLFVRGVPNAPCGVERTPLLKIRKGRRRVPNAPCGVERHMGGLRPIKQF